MWQTPCTLQVLPKPDRFAQRFYNGARRVLFTKEIYAKRKSTEVSRSKNFTDRVYMAFMAAMHGLCLAAPFTFSWGNLGLFAATYFLTGCLGITLSYHRQLAHKSFRTPKWLEYLLAYCGALAVQGDPKEWVSTHRSAPLPPPLLLLPQRTSAAAAAAAAAHKHALSKWHCLAAGL